jgi:DNA polymerase III epsilon subunit-like protein
MATFSVIDVETTGLRPGERDRVVEVAVVRLGADHEVIDEWSTLIDPSCPVRGARIHGIYSATSRMRPPSPTSPGTWPLRCDC